MDESRIDKISRSGKEQTPSKTPSDFDRAAFTAETLLRDLVSECEPTWDELCIWYLAFFQTAGHRRLGAIIKRVAQEYVQSSGG